MGAILDAFWRAVAYCLHPRVMLWSLVPLLVAGGTVGLLGWLYWEPTVAAVRETLAQWELLAALMRWLDSIGGEAAHALLAPILVLALAVPVIVLVALVAVALFMTPAIVSLVAARRFPDLERRHGAGWWQGLAWSLACTAAALLAMLLSIPLWFVPPLVLVIPPLIWGWLSYRVFAFDVLAVHASADERRQLIERLRWPLLAMGVLSGYLGSAPSMLWAWGVAAVPLAPLLAVASVWLYTLVFAFASCWFAHYLLAALQLQRWQAAQATASASMAADAGVVVLRADPSPEPPPPPRLPAP